MGTNNDNTKGFNNYLLFEHAAKLYPNDYCLLFKESYITYKQLEEKVSQVYTNILEHAKNEKIIGLPTTRGIDQIVFMLAILKAGKAYLPIDFSYPKSRIENIINNSKINFCLSTFEDSGLVASMGLNVLPSNDSKSSIYIKDQDSMAQNATYILYTSGSTGEPKGVCLGQQATTNLINWQIKNSVAKNKTRTLQFAPLTFDVSFQEIMSTLSIGGTLALIEDELRLDMVALLKFIEKHEINRLFLPFVALQALAETAVSMQHFPQCIQEIMTAGEQLKITPQVTKFFSSINNCKLYNQYGPTECHVVSELKLNGNPINWPALPSIGKPIENTQIYILNKENHIVTQGEIGELCISGACLAEGYLGNENLTKEKFIWVNLTGSNKTRIYRTGDIARFLPDGNIEFLGRQDDQVKISGHRIELAEVELALNNLPSIQQAVVVASNHLENVQLVAYLQSNNDSKDINTNEFREQVAQILPSYMLPTHYVWVKEFPKTSSGKIDKKSLPPVEYSRPSSAPLYKKPVTETQKNITKILANLLRIPKIGIFDNFFEMGGTSLLAQKVIANLRQQYGYDIPVTKLYQFPSVSELSEYIDTKRGSKTKLTVDQEQTKGSSQEIAIIGMAGRFPGAQSINELWEVLKEGKETISFFTPEELDPTIPESILNDSLYVKARGIVPSVKEFDADFFGLNQKIATAMDPQQRLFLEIAWEVLEQAGYLPNLHNGIVGVYAGTGMNTYYKNNVLFNEELIDQVGSFQASTVNEKDYISSRVAYHLNLKGPAVSVHSACSTSLLAITEAVKAIKSGQCDVALAGGASITSPIYSGHLYQEGSMLSPDGHCRPFDANAKGTIFSDGAGVVLLKSLEAAEKDGDTIYGIIKGIGVNNDGGNKGSFTAPSAIGQANAIKKALTDARISPDTLSYIEAHGTATPIGDPIEIEGLQMAFGEQNSKNYCAIGSIKSNMGHLTAAAGVAGLIKTVLAMHYKQIPASLGFEKPNPAIDFENSPFYVNQKLTHWESNSIRRAGVSSFGVGGTNVHVILEEYQNKVEASGPGRPLELLTWSAKTQNSVSGYKTALGHYLKNQPDMPLADVAYSLSMTRDNFSHRSFMLSDSITQASENLLDSGIMIKSNVLKVVPNELAFLYTGQGAQYVNMGKSLYENEPIYKDTIDTCAELLRKDLEMDIREILYPSNNIEKAREQLNDTKFTQPALFVTEYALTKLWLSWGIKPTLLCGHSIGEFVAAHISGIFSLEDALHLIATRGKLMSSLPKGSMLSVRLSLEKLKPLIPQTLSVAAINSSQSCVVAGQTADIEAFEKTLISSDITCKILATSHAFHSFMMDPILETFKVEVDKVQKNIPRIPIASTATGEWLTDSEALSSDYWTNHLRQTVHYGDAVNTILKLEDVVLLEVGPGHTLTTLARQQSSGNILTAFASLPTENKDILQDEYQTILTTLGSLWLHGLTPDWKTFYGQQKRQKVNLPSYVFDKKPCWIDAPSPKGPTIPKLLNNTIADIPISSSTKISPMRKNSILNKISEIVSLSSGIDYESHHSSHSFIELGLDSLALTQLSLKLKKEFNLPITFRQLNEEYGSPDLLAEYIDKNTATEEPSVTNIIANNANHAPQVNGSPIVNIPQTNIGSLDLIQQQIQLLSMQISLMQSNNLLSNANTPIAYTNNSAAPRSTGNVLNADILTDDEKKEHSKPFGASPKIERQNTELNPLQLNFIKDLEQKYNSKTQKSKDYAQKHRSHMADPRVVSGFRPLTKEMVYPLVIKKSSGNRLWDLDNNQYIDALNGFGSCMLGHQPDFIKQALHDQIEQGYEVGPQHPLAGEVCKLLCEFTGHDRAALCNTGSEAVLGAVRIARTVTGRSLIVSFSGSYHGINDEALVRGSKKLKTFPASAGILSDNVQNVLVLEYGTDESLNIIRERGDEIAAVLVEPVQSRRPEFQPVDFLKALRTITEKSNTLLIFDEVITGFRSHPGGVQALFGIKADIATYGKVIGGGISIGAILGKREYMDALDGGFWQYGDQSIPEVGVTYFAGTFVRHPLALAAAKASLLYMKEQGPSLQHNLTSITTAFAENLTKEFQNRRLPIIVTHFSSLWRIKFLEDIPYSELLFVLLRHKGIHIMDGFPCFMTTAYTSNDVDYLSNCIIESIDEMIKAGILIQTAEHQSFKGFSQHPSTKLNIPPVPGARLGRDEAGNPAWFVEDKHNKNNYIKIGL